MDVPPAVPRSCWRPDSPTQRTDGLSRRRWLQLMGASLALAGVAGCRWEKREIRPFAKRPADRIPGESQRFATTMDMAGAALGLLVTCVDGRPIKVEGNPKHPSSLGATNAFAQAAILELYDPDRSKDIIQRIDGREEVRTLGGVCRLRQRAFCELRRTAGRACGCFPRPAVRQRLAGCVVVAEAVSEGEMVRIRADCRDHARAGSRMAAP